MKEIRWLLEEKYGGKRTEAAEKDIVRLEKGEHVDYVIGWVDFLDCRIDLSQKPLIPRPETEYWTEKAIREMQARASRAMQCRVLDIFAGSGCIGIAVLKHIPWAKVDFAEKEKKFLKQIEINAKLNGIAPSRYRLIQSDVFSNVKGKYDYILANPPYISEKSKHQIQESVLRWEPHNALFGGQDGLQFIRELADKGMVHLRAGGKMYIEFDTPSKNMVEKVLSENNLSHSFFKDQFGKWRYVRINRLGR